MSSNQDLGALPPGWDTKFDPRTGRYYFINHYTKSTSWEDPRVRYQQIGKPTGAAATSSTSSKENKPEESKPLQDLSNRRTGSPVTGRSSSSQPQMGTQAATTTAHMMLNNQSTASPLPIARLQLEETIGAAASGDRGMGSPMSQRSAFHQTSARRESSHVLSDILEVETTSSKGDQTDAAINNISAMFPTVDEGHIRDLLKKESRTNYLSGQDVFSKTLPQSRVKTRIGKSYALQDVELDFDDGGPSSKQYLKSVFPTVEEYLLLDVLSNSDNNVQKAGDRLVKMGYVKRDTPSAPRLHARRKEEERLAEKRTPLPKPPPIKSDKEKEELRKKMKDKYEVKFDIPERILYMALESVLYDEDQANNLILSMIEDDLKRKKAKEVEKQKEKEKRKSPKPQRKAIENERLPKHTSPKHEPSGKSAPHGKKGWSSKTNLKDDMATTSRGTWTQEDKSQCSKLAKGPNPSLRKGPNDGLLLTDYVTWNGPDPELRNGSSKSNAKGPNKALRKGASGLANGPNRSLCKGPKKDLARGTILNTGEIPESRLISAI